MHIFCTPVIEIDEILRKLFVVKLRKDRRGEGLYIVAVVVHFFSILGHHLTPSL